MITLLPQLRFDREALASDAASVPKFVGAYLGRPAHKSGEGAFEVSFGPSTRGAGSPERAMAGVKFITQQLKVEPTLVRFLKTTAGKSSGAHQDTGRKCAINIPVLGYENSCVRFPEHGVQVTSACPMLIDVSLLHEVANHGDEDRIVLSLGFRNTYAELLQLLVAGLLLR